MKKIFTIIAVAAMLAVSCQKETPATDNPGSSSAGGKLTATISQTKVTYAESGNDLQPAWEVGDKIIGFDDAGSTYTLTVASVEAETATLEGTVPDGALHLIYKSGASASDISAKTLAIDYKNQAGDKTMPAVMLADGTVADGSCNFAFTNAGAIIGISAVKGIPSGATISKITVEGENLFAATVALSGSALALSATPAATDAISTATLSGVTVTDANGTLSTPLYIAVPAGAVIKKVSASVSDKTYSYTLAAAKTAAAGEYLHVKTQEFKALPAGALPGKFSVSNDGGTTIKKVHFSQGNLYYDGSKFNFEANQYDTTPASNDSWSPDHISHFYWSKDASVAYANSYSEPGTTESDVFFTNADETTAKEGFTVNVGGKEQSGWRTLSTNEWQYLFNTRTDASNKYGYATVGGVNGIIILPDNFTDPMKNNGSGAFVPELTTGWTQNVYTSGDNWNAMETAGAVFLPAAGWRSSSDDCDVYQVGENGSYWASSAFDAWCGHQVFFCSTYIFFYSLDDRYYGNSVRLITE